jgi:hypothetical protein
MARELVEMPDELGRQNPELVKNVRVLSRKLEKLPHSARQLSDLLPVLASTI